MGEWRSVELRDLAIEDDGLVLRPATEADIPVITAALQDRRMHTYVDLPDPYTTESARQFVQAVAAGRGAGRSIEGVIELDGRVCGAGGLRLPVGRGATGAEIGYSVYPSAQGRGLAARVSRVLADWVFARGVARAFIRSDVANLASVKSALNAGFPFEGIARADIDSGSGARDAAVFGRVPADDGAPVAPAVRPLPAGGLDDGTIRLRPLGPADAEAFHDERADAEALRWEFFADSPTLAQSRRLCELAGLQWLVGPQARMAIVDDATGETAGSISLRVVGPPGVALVGYGLRASWRGRGYTARALRLLRPWALSAGGGGLHRLELGAKTANVASCRAAASGGFAAEGVQAGRLRNADGTFSDEAIFASLD